MKYSEIARENYDKVIEAIKRLERSNPQFDIDLYLYPDGSVYEFENCGGNSWLDDEHKVIYTANHEFWDIPKEFFDENGNYDPAEYDLEEMAKQELDYFIEKMEEEESWEEEEEEDW